MKKLIVLGIVAMMVMGLAVAGNSAVWYVSVRSAAGGNGTNVQFGNTGSTTGSFSSQPAGTDCIAFTGNQAWAPGGDAGTLYQKFQSATTFNANSSYTLAVWANTSAAPYNPATVKVWLASGADVAGKSWGIYDAAGVLLGSAIADTTHTSEASKLFSFTATIPVTADPASQAAVWTFKQTVPEPGSMLAMLSGMVGLLGYGIRRRK